MCAAVYLGASFFAVDAEFLASFQELAKQDSPDVYAFEREWSERGLHSVLILYDFNKNQLTAVYNFQGYQVAVREAALGWNVDWSARREIIKGSSDTVFWGW
jgi:hypothetical protein